MWQTCLCCVRPQTLGDNHEEATGHSSPKASENDPAAPEIQHYCTITHHPSKDIPVADTLSRKSLVYHDTSLSEGMDVQVHTVFRSMLVSENRLNEICVETEKDEQLTLLGKVIQAGWLDDRKKLPTVSEGVLESQR